MAELATFCWGLGSETARALVLDHLARCPYCRAVAARIAVHSGDDEPSSEDDMEEN